jgi:hypothetical protein
VRNYVELPGRARLFGKEMNAVDSKVFCYWNAAVEKLARDGMLKVPAEQLLLVTDPVVTE